MRLVLVFSGFLAALARGATPIDAALARDKAARRVEAALARARAAGVPDAERYDAAWVAESVKKASCPETFADRVESAMTKRVEAQSRSPAGSRPLVSPRVTSAVAAATSDAPRGTLLSALTGRVDDTAAPERGDDEFADAGRRASPITTRVRLKDNKTGTKYAYENGTVEVRSDDQRWVAVRYPNGTQVEAYLAVNHALGGGDVPVITTFFPNDTRISYYPTSGIRKKTSPDGRRVDMFPDGTRVVFNVTLAKPLEAFSNAIAIWHNLSDKDLTRMLWFAAKGNLWTIKAATILVPLRVVALRIYLLVRAVFFLGEAMSCGEIVIADLCMIVAFACLVAFAIGWPWMFRLLRLVLWGLEATCICGHAFVPFVDGSDDTGYLLKQKTLRDRMFGVRSAFLVLLLLGPAAVVNVLTGEFGVGVEGGFWTDARAVLSPFFVGAGAWYLASRISEIYYGLPLYGCAFTALLYCVLVNVAGWMGYSGPWLTCLGLWATLMAGIKRDHVLDFFACAVRFVLTPFNWASARTATSSTLIWVLLAAYVVSAIPYAYDTLSLDKISRAAVADVYTYLKVGRRSSVLWANLQWVCKWWSIFVCTCRCAMGFIIDLHGRVIMPWFTGVSMSERLRECIITGGRGDPRRPRRKHLARAIVAVFLGAYAAACYYYLHLVAALGWVMILYGMCKLKPSDGSKWLAFCLTFPPVADYDAIAAAVATELRIDEALNEFSDLGVAWWSVMMIIRVFRLAIAAWATAAFIGGRPVAVLDLFTGPASNLRPKFAELALAFFGVHKAWLYVAGRRCDVAFLSNISWIVLGFESFIAGNAWRTGLGRAASKDHALARLSALPAGARQLAKATVTVYRTIYLNFGVLACVPVAINKLALFAYAIGLIPWPGALLGTALVVVFQLELVAIAIVADLGTMFDKPTAARIFASRSRPPEPARAPEPDAKSEPEIVEADLNSDEGRVIERMKAGRAFGEAEVAARERENAGARAESAAALAFVTAWKAEGVAAEASRVALTAALRFVEAEEERERQRRAAAAEDVATIAAAQASFAAMKAAAASRRIDTELRAAAAEEERRAAAAAEAKRRAAKAKRRARAEAEARAARAAEELIADEEAAAAAAATKRPKKKKKKKGRASLTVEPPPREEAKDEVPTPAPAAPPPKRPETTAPAPAPAARRTLAELVAAEDAPAPPTEAPPDSTILPLLQDDVEADPAVAALLAKVGLERLAVAFAREQIDATTLPLLSLEDLVDVGLSTADAERVVAAAAPSDPVTAPASEGGVPENLCCPISMEIMEQPVLAADGFTYDRHAIAAWLARGKATSPTTGAPLAHTMLTPNHLVKSMIAEYQESKGS